MSENWPEFITCQLMRNAVVGFVSFITDRCQVLGSLEIIYWLKMRTIFDR